jgi:molybdopterin converting factor small subunit
LDRGAVPTVHFTTNLQRHVSCPAVTVDGATVAECLEQVFAANPRARGYVLDEHGAVRRHMNVFVDNEQIRDRQGLSDAVVPESEIYVMQALSGG